MREFEILEEFLDFAWAQISRGRADKKSPARCPTFITKNNHGYPRARTLVLRRSNRESDEIEFHTDKTSQKMLSLEKDPRAGIHFWLPRTQLQIQMDVIVEVRVGELTLSNWKNVPNSSRSSFGTIPSPGTVIQKSLDYSQLPDQNRFAILICHIKLIELLHLGAKHVRARFMKSQQWNGQWLAP